MGIDMRPYALARFVLIDGDLIATLFLFFVGKEREAEGRQEDSDYTHAKNPYP